MSKKAKILINFVLIMMALFIIFILFDFMLSKKTILATKDVYATVLSYNNGYKNQGYLRLKDTDGKIFDINYRKYECKDVFMNKMIKENTLLYLPYYVVKAETYSGFYSWNSLQPKYNTTSIFCNGILLLKKE